MSDPNNENLLFNGELEIFPITDSLHDEITEFNLKDYIKNGNVSRALDIGGTEQSLAELETIFRFMLKDNLGFIVRDNKSKDIVAMCVNNMLDSEKDSSPNFQFQSHTIKRAGEFLQQIKSSFNIFKEWNIDCAMEIVILSTRKDFGGRGLASILSARSIEFAGQILAGTLPLEKKLALPEHIRELKPQAVCSVFTSLYTQKMGQKLDFETFVEIPYTELFYEGKSFAERIDPIHKSATYVGRKL